MPFIGFRIILKKSWQQTVYILFKTFSVKKWICLLFIAWLAGGITLGQGGGGTFSNNNFNSKQSPQPNAAQSSQGQGAQANNAASSAPGSTVEVMEEVGVAESEQSENSADKFDPRKLLHDFNSKLQAQFGALYWIVLISVCGGLLFLSLLFFWLQARFRFVWIQSILKNEVKIVNPFKEFARESNSLFLATVVFWCVVLVTGSWCVSWIIGEIRTSGIFSGNFEWTLANAWYYFGRYVLIVGFLIMLYYQILIFMIDFIVPIMTADRCGAVSATKTFLSLLINNLGKFFFYYLIRFFLTILLWLSLSTMIVLGIIIVALLAAILIGIPYVVFMVWLKQKAIFYVLTLFIGIFIAVINLLVISLPALPFAVFYRCYPLYFLAGLEGGRRLVRFDDDFSGNSSQVEGDFQ